MTVLIQKTRVLVIDDVYDEVKKLLWTLNKNGLAFNYYKGNDYRELPHKPLKGVRLLFLDFVLGTDGQSDDNKIATLMSVIKKTISPDNGPYIILTWTKHDTPQDNLLDLFKEKMIKSQSMPIPIAIINLEKRDCMDSLPRIEKNIKQRINDKEILEILINWEVHADSASCDVLNTLAEISKPHVTQGQSFDEYSSVWNANLERHIYRIAESSLGKNTKPDKDLLIAAQLSFTEIFRDQIEKIIKNKAIPFKKLIQKICSHDQKKYSLDETAYMNTSFLVISKELDKILQPGNIYRFNQVMGKIECEKKDCYWNQIKIKKEEIVRKFYEGQLRAYKNKAILIKEVIPVLIEITPECDYAQQNWSNAIMVLGVLWPYQLNGVTSAVKKPKSANHLYKPLPIKYHDKIYYLTFDAHHLYQLSFKIFDSIAPIMKARKELLVDIQHWYSRHVSRPGKTEF